jgi:GNAT superfamily N-acetyltransferase
MTIGVERITGLPDGFMELKADAEADGHAHLNRLAIELGIRPSMFHAIFVCHLEGELAGIGAITDEPAPTLEPAWRMRRLYVHRSFRRRHVAREIARALLDEAKERVSIVTVHAGNDSAGRFWEAMGFHHVAGRAWSHQITLGRAG